MPPALLKCCSHVGCPNLTEGRHCEQHKRDRDGFRRKTTERGYGADWQKVRKAVLIEEPICRECKRAAAEIVDHIIPIEQRRDLRLVRTNLQPLCKACHAVKTGQAKGGRGGSDL